ncbi:indolepyruvate ferredoxin oxidoreductase beta subunit [Thermosyntropha lipolytica DSM 11003]|uniref:Indolepyruvate ferredoxin oxidoreductase beta subunit n=1 Tax=Thermosyntropha lipolytica DSM 11003 TaxID=1123382 RepID=A0A1M5L9U1_9FIRM|nr:indolepyruvate oxidoreductase subunit beta [Thermosyntropha lipolytica]SHG61193.1 indolepyruvate ferredoxin oxidoreductase beta subunit [Thermosyntropha lipolytica DSM 11003]
MSKEVKNILIVGVGGQGTLLTSRIIAQVAVQMGYDVKISEVHGMAQRGGSVVSQVRYGEKVYSPIIKKGDADVILGFEKIEAARWLSYLKPEGILIVNDERIDPLPVMSGKARYPDDIIDKMKGLVPSTLVVNASDIALKCGDIKVANVVLVGVLSKVMELPIEEVEKAIIAIVPPKYVDLNIKAFHEGLKLV